MNRSGTRVGKAIGARRASALVRGFAAFALLACATLAAQTWGPLSGNGLLDAHGTAFDLDALRGVPTVFVVVEPEDFELLQGPRRELVAFWVDAELKRQSVPENYSRATLLLGACPEETSLAIARTVVDPRPVLGTSMVAVSRNDWRPEPRYVWSFDSDQGFRGGLMVVDGYGRAFSSWEELGRAIDAEREAVEILRRWDAARPALGTDGDIRVLHGAESEGARKAVEALESALVSMGWDSRVFVRVDLGTETSAPQVEGEPSTEQRLPDRLRRGGIVLYDAMTDGSYVFGAGDWDVERVSTVADNMRVQRVVHVLREFDEGTYGKHASARDASSRLAWLDCAALLRFAACEQSWRQPVCMQPRVGDLISHAKVGTLLLWLAEGVRLDRRFPTDDVLPGRADDPVRDERVFAYRRWWEVVKGMPLAPARKIEPQRFSSFDLGW